MSRRTQYKHLLENGFIQDHFAIKNRRTNYGFSDEEFLEMNHTRRNRIITKLRFLGFTAEAMRLKNLKNEEDQNS